MERALLIINPISGTSKKKDLCRYVTERLRSRGIDVRTCYTEYPGHAREIAGSISEEECSLVIVAGGDGTINEVATGLCDKRITMGILPFGSGNGLARHIGVYKDLEHSMRVIEECHVIDADCGTVNGRPFFTTFGMGFDAAVSEKFAGMKRRGPLSYIKSAVKEFIKYEPYSYKLTIEGIVYEFKAFLLTVANASQYGNNAFIAPSASIKDGWLDVTIIHNEKPLKLVAAGLELFTGQLDKNLTVQRFKIKECIIETDATVAHVDGEPLSVTSPIEIKCRPGVLRLCTVSGKKAFKPVISPIRYFARDVVLGVKHIFKR